jgi:transposase InsO family protein
LLTLIDEAVRAGARRKRACEVLGISTRSTERWRSDDVGDDQRHGPATKPSHALTAQERTAITERANAPEYRNLPPEQVVARLADEGIYICSERSLDRILHDEKLHKHRSRARPAEQAKPREFVANGPCQVTTWDITYLRSPVRGQFYYLYLFLDIWSRRILGFQVCDIEDAQLAATLLKQVCAEHGLEHVDAVLHSDNGAAMKGSTMLATMQWLGIRSSFSRPGVSDDNAHVEALFKTLKYRPGYPARGFDSLEHATAWVTDFVRWYNYEHLHSAIGFVTPDDRHTGRDIDVLAHRRAVYEAAQERNPRRWTKSVRRWHRPRVALLNPERATRLREKQQAMVA